MFRCSFYAFLILLLLYKLCGEVHWYSADFISIFNHFYLLKILIFFERAKGQIMSECIYEITHFPKDHQKNLIDFYPESLFRLCMLCTHLSRVVSRIIKTSHMCRQLTSERNLQNFTNDN